MASADERVPHGARKLTRHKNLHVNRMLRAQKANPAAMMFIVLGLVGGIPMAAMTKQMTARIIRTNRIGFMRLLLPAAGVDSPPETALVAWPDPQTAGLARERAGAPAGPASCPAGVPERIAVDRELVPRGERCDRPTAHAPACRARRSPPCVHSGPAIWC